MAVNLIFQPEEVTDVNAFKKEKGLFPLPKPFIKIEPAAKL